MSDADVVYVSDPQTIIVAVGQNDEVTIVESGETEAIVVTEADVSVEIVETEATPETVVEPEEQEVIVISDIAAGPQGKPGEQGPQGEQGPPGPSDHGSLSGLEDDDHLQYMPVSGEREFTGPVTAPQVILKPASESVTPKRGGIRYDEEEDAIYLCVEE